jgi:hypothetical protein
LTVVDETLSAVERRFGSTLEGQLLDRFALEAAIDLLSSPARVVDVLPGLAHRRAGGPLGVGLEHNR